MEESQGELPGGDAAYIVYSNKSKVLRVASEGKGCSVPRWQRARQLQGQTGKSTEPCMEAASSTDLQLRGLSVGRDLRGIATQTSFLVNDISGLSILEILTKVPCCPQECRHRHQHGIGPWNQKGKTESL